MNSFITVLLFCSIIFCIPICLILLFKNRNNTANQLLALAFISLGCYATSQFLFLTHFILDIPIVYKLFKPFYLVMPPCIYLYVKSILSTSNPKFSDFWWHFLPLLISLTDIIAWLEITDVERYGIVQSIIINYANIYNEVPGVTHIWLYQAAVPIQGVVYICYLVICLRLSREKYKDQFQSKLYKSYYLFAQLLTMLQAILYFSLIAFTAIFIMNYTNRSVLVNAIYLPAVIMCTAILLITTYLYMHPALLGLCNKSEVPESETTVVYTGLLERLPIEGETRLSTALIIKEPLFSLHMVQKYQHILELELNENKIFKQHGLSLRELAIHCNIPLRGLSFLIGSVYGKHFNDFINEYRIQYVINRMKAVDWKGLTLEGLAREAGFASRTTFFTAFKKKKGMSPTQFLQTLSENQRKI